MSTKENKEVQMYLDELTAAWRVYEATYNDPSRQLEHLDATWRCNRALEVLYSMGLAMRKDYDWSSKQRHFVILDKSTTI